MNYQRIYDIIISNANLHNRVKFDGAYYEKHHIIPRCLKGSEEKENKVLLTAKEHFVCHKLLTYLYPHHPGIAMAFHSMCFRRSNRHQKIILSSRDYKYARELCTEALSGEKNGNYGNKLSKDHRDKMIEGRRKYNEKRKLNKQIELFFHPFPITKYKLTDEEIIVKRNESGRRSNAKRNEFRRLHPNPVIWTDERRKEWSNKVKESFKRPEVKLKNEKNILYQRSEEGREEMRTLTGCYAQRPEEKLRMDKHNEWQRSKEGRERMSQLIIEGINRKKF